MSFFVTLTTVAILLLYAVPGYLLVKSRAVKGEHIPNFSKLLLYVCSPCMIVYSFRKMQFSAESVKNLVLCFVITLVFQFLMLFLYFLLFRKRRQDILWRIVNIAAVFANCGFLGIPILEALLPTHPEAVAYSSIYTITMNLLGWSFGMYIVSLDKTYIKPRKMFLNPASIGLFISIPLFVFSVSLPTQIEDMITLLGKMCTPLCMLIMGMRLATVKIKDIFCDGRQYLAVVLKQIVFPLVAFALLFFLPISPVLKQAIFILCACPVASVVQNYAELLGKGNDKAANMVLLGTIISIVTLPVMCLLLG